MYTLTLILIIGLITLIIYKPSRFYLLSFIFPWLYNHPRISKLLGIRYEDDQTWESNRKETQVYMPGFFIWVFTKFSGMDLILSDDIRKKTMRLQQQESDKFDMNQYFHEIDGKTITLEQFENYLAAWILRESNRVFNIIDKTQEDVLHEHVLIIKTIINSVIGNIYYGLYVIATNIISVIKMSKIIRSVPEEKRLFLFVPQLALVGNFAKTIAKTRGNFNGVKPHDFLDLTSKFSVFINNGQLVFIKRNPDKSDNANNRAFGPKGVQCPGAISVIKFFKIIIEFLQSFDITVSGEPAKYSDERFIFITNKDKILVTFNHK